MCGHGFTWLSEGTFRQLSVTLFYFVNLKSKKYFHLTMLEHRNSSRECAVIVLEKYFELGENLSVLSENEYWIHNRCNLSFSHLVWIHPHLFIVGCSYLLSCLFLTLGATSKEDVVYQCVLQQSQENKDEAPHEVHVYGLDIGNFGEGFSQVGVNGSHGEHRGNTWYRWTIFITL